MSRSTFEGPILSGDNRFGSQRDVGLVKLAQYANLVLTNTTAGTAGFGGSSGTFVTSNGIPNNVATIYNPQSGSYSATGPTVATAPTADASTAIYRGAVFLLPQQSTITAINLDTVVVPTVAAGSITAITPYISNNFATSAGVYATSAALSAVSAGTVTVVASDSSISASSSGLPSAVKTYTTSFGVSDLNASISNLNAALRVASEIGSLSSYITQPNSLCLQMCNISELRPSEISIIEVGLISCFSKNSIMSLRASGFNKREIT